MTIHIIYATTSNTHQGEKKLSRVSFNWTTFLMRTSSHDPVAYIIVGEDASPQFVRVIVMYFSFYGIFVFLVFLY